MDIVLFVTLTIHGAIVERPIDLSVELKHFGVSLADSTVIVDYETFKLIRSVNGGKIPSYRILILENKPSFRESLKERGFAVVEPTEILINDRPTGVFSLTQSVMETAKRKRVIVVGSAMLCWQFLRQINRVYITVGPEVSGDTDFFVNLPDSSWQMASDREFTGHNNTRPSYFETWVRRSAPPADTHLVL